MHLTFTFAPGFLEAPDQIHEDAVKLAKLVLVWWNHEEFLARLEDMVYPAPEIVQLARKILGREHAKNLL